MRLLYIEKPLLNFASHKITKDSLVLYQVGKASASLPHDWCRV